MDEILRSDRLPRVIAFAHPDNVASVAVMKKIGLQYLRHDTLRGLESVVYGTSAFDRPAIQPAEDPARRSP